MPFTISISQATTVMKTHKVELVTGRAVPLGHCHAQLQFAFYQWNRDILATQIQQTLFVITFGITSPCVLVMYDLSLRKGKKLATTPADFIVDIQLAPT